MHNANLSTKLETITGHKDGQVELFFTDFNVDAPKPSQIQKNMPLIVNTHDRNDILVVMVDSVIFKLDNNNPPENSRFVGNEIQLYLYTNSDAVTGGFSFYYRKRSLVLTNHVDTDHRTDLYKEGLKRFSKAPA